MEELCESQWEKMAALTKVLRVKLGSQALEVSKQDLGCMGMSSNYDLPKPEPYMIELIHHAIDSGVNFLDTSDVYGPHTNELTIRKDVMCLRLKADTGGTYGSHGFRNDDNEEIASSMKFFDLGQG